MIYREPGLVRRPLPPPPPLFLSVSSTGDKQERERLRLRKRDKLLTGKRGEGGGRRAESYDRKKARSSTCKSFNTFCLHHWNDTARPLISIFPSVLSGYITPSIGTNDIYMYLSVLNQVLRRISGKDKQHIFNVEVAWELWCKNAL
jgi:hypothetical protein